MASADAYLKPADVKIEVVVLRAVPCAAHAVWTGGCPDCLTGEQARERGVEQNVDDLGEVAATGFHPFARLASSFRIRRINRQRKRVM